MSQRRRDEEGEPQGFTWWREIALIGSALGAVALVAGGGAPADAASQLRGELSRGEARRALADSQDVDASDGRGAER